MCHAGAALFFPGLTLVCVLFQQMIYKSIVTSALNVLTIDLTGDHLLDAIQMLCVKSVYHVTSSFGNTPFQTMTLSSQHPTSKRCPPEICLTRTKYGVQWKTCNFTCCFLGQVNLNYICMGGYAINLCKNPPIKVPFIVTACKITTSFSWTLLTFVGCLLDAWCPGLFSRSDCFCAFFSGNLSGRCRHIPPLTLHNCNLKRMSHFKHEQFVQLISRQKLPLRVF